MIRPLEIADLFCGAGGTSTGAVQAAEALGYSPRVTAVNHWTRAVETHSANHPAARHLCASVDSLNPRSLYNEGQLDILWASPECTHHSRARGGRPMRDQSRATAWCVARWAEALRPGVIMVENVPEFTEWGPLDANGKPEKAQKGETFRAWIAALESLGYTVEWRILCAANYGDPTTRRRLFVQAVRGRRKIVWPEPAYLPSTDLLGKRPWKSAENHVIDWSIPTPPIDQRKRPLATKTLERIERGLRAHGGIGGAFLLPQQSDGRLRSVSEPAPTVATAGAIALVIEYYGNGQARPVSKPLPTVTCNDRFALLRVEKGRRCFRMLQPHELAAAQGFPRGYHFAGTKTEQIRQIGNAVPCGFARALIAAQLTQNPDVRQWMTTK